MKTYKEFITILEKFKNFPEDKVSRQIERKKKKGSSEDAHKMKVTKNFMTKSSDDNNAKRSVDTIKKNLYATVHKGDVNNKNANNVDVISRLVKGHTKKSKLKDLDKQTDFNKKIRKQKEN